MTKPISLALVGIGKIARDQHVPAIRAAKSFYLAATVSREGQLPDIPAFHSIAALLDSGISVDAVSLCTPPQVRGDLAREAMAAGLAVMLEKPPAATLAEFEDLCARAKTANVTLFATWHSRYAPKVADARDFLETRTVKSGKITWREDVRRWHPGQQWLWAPGGLGVFDPGINALSILTEILPQYVMARSAVLEVPSNCHTPIAAQLALESGGASIAVDFDFRQTGPQSWDIELETTCGHHLKLADGGAQMTIDGGAPSTALEAEYPNLYNRFATLYADRKSDADAAPLRLVADAFMIAERKAVDPFIEESHDLRKGIAS